MHVSGIGLTGKSAFTAQSSAVGASTELQTLFSKLHLDAATSLAAVDKRKALQSAASVASTSSAHGTTNDLFSNLRSLFDGGLSVVSKVARTAETVASAYATGGGAAAITHAAIDKLG